jgi:hypothetical protein
MPKARTADDRREPRKGIKPAAEFLEKRLVPDDIFGILSVGPVLGTRLALLGGFTTPSLVLFRGWAANQSSEIAVAPSSGAAQATSGAAFDYKMGNSAAAWLPLGWAGPQMPPIPATTQSGTRLAAGAGSGDASRIDQFRTGSAFDDHWLDAVDSFFANQQSNGGDLFGGEAANRGGGGGGASGGSQFEAPEVGAPDLSGGGGSLTTAQLPILATSSSSSSPSAPSQSQSTSGAVSAPIPGSVAARLLTSGANAAPRSAGSKPASTPGSSTTSSALLAYGKLPLMFEQNVGQTDPSVQFIVRGSGFNAFLTSTSEVLTLPQSLIGPSASVDSSLLPGSGRAVPPAPPEDVLQIQLVGSDPSSRAIGQDVLQTVTNYFVGNDPSQWRTNVQNFGKVVYQNIYPGVNEIYYGTTDGQFENDFVVAPGVDPGIVQMSVHGAQGVGIDASGNLVLSTGSGNRVVERVPTLYQDEGGVRHLVSGGYQIEAGDKVGFRVGSYDSSRPLTIDPQLIYSTYVGGSGSDKATAVAVDASGAAYVAGYTTSASFPTQNPVQGTYGGGTDAFVAKLNPSGSSLMYATYLGGSNQDEADGIAVDAAGNAYVVGTTYSSDYPTANAFQSSLADSLDAFVTKLSPTGTTLVYSTYLGGTDGFQGAPGTQGFAIAVDATGSAYITGHTESPSFPLQNPFQSAASLGAFVTKFSPSGSSLVYSTYFGGSGTSGSGIAVDNSGDAYITGRAGTIPTQNPIQGSPPGSESAFVSEFSPSGTTLVYSTYLGGDRSAYGTAIAVDNQGCAYVTGSTNSTRFPVVNAFESTGGSVNTVFVTKYSPNGTSLVFSTYLDGAQFGEGIAVDSTSEAYVTGSGAVGSSFPVLGWPLPNAGAQGAFVTKFSSVGTSLVYSSLLGQGVPGDTAALGIAVDGSGNAYVAGYTDKTSFPLQNPLQSTNGGSFDAFVSKVGYLPVQAPTLESVGEFDVDVSTGGLRLTQALDFDLSPGTSVGGDPALDYNSDTVSVHPIVEVNVPLPASYGVPTQLVATPTWNNGSPQGAVAFSTSGHHAGDTYLIADQVAATVTQDGAYPWSLTVEADFSSGNPVTFTYSGLELVAVNDQANSVGAGWGIDGISRLVPVAAGVLMVTGAGDVEYFAGGPSIHESAERFRHLGGVEQRRGDHVYVHGQRPDR